MKFLASRPACPACPTFARQAWTPRPPVQVVADGGFTSRENILTIAEKDVDLVGSLDEHDAQSAGQRTDKNTGRKADGHAT